ncbi:MAG: hypothetical protein GXO94_08905 [Nitrospirae bacterium]|nr:hypothetical protein [Nitrospirota bacterium]
MNRKGPITVSLLAVLTPATLYMIRSADTNFTLRWPWLFEGLGSAETLLILVPGTVTVTMLAWWLSGKTYHERRPAAFLFSVSFVTAAVFWLEPQFNIDTSRYFLQAKHLEMYGIGYFFREWGGEIGAWTDSPLLPFIYGLIFRFAGEKVIYIGAFTTLLFSLTVVLTHLIGKRLWNERTGLYGGLFMLGIPYIFTQVPLMMVDVPTMFFLALAVYGFIRVMDEGGIWRTVSSSITVFLAMFSKYSTWPMLSVLAVILAVYSRGKAPKEVLARAAAVALAATVLTSVAVALKYDVVSRQFGILTGYQVTVLDEWTETFASAFLFQSHPFMAASAVCSAYVAVRKRDPRYAIICYLPALLVIFRITLLRYIIPLFPMIALTASYGLNGIGDIRLRRFIVLCTVMTSLLLAYSLYLPFLQRHSSMNLKMAGKALNRLDISAVEVFTLPQRGSDVNPAIAVPILDLFTDKEIIYDYRLNSSRVERPPEGEILTSPTRFTWEYRNPAFYAPEGRHTGGETAVVVISGTPNPELPGYVEQRTEGRRIYGVFETSTPGLLKYRTFVTVYD